LAGLHGLREEFLEISSGCSETNCGVAKIFYTIPTGEVFVI
jgi:hypothetical protein